MIALKLNDTTTLDLAPDARIRVVLSCPMFDRDRILRTFSYPFGLPLTPRNARALAYIHRFDSREAWDAEGCGLWLGGAEYERGEIVSIGSGEREIEAVFRNVPLPLMDDLKRIYINEILEDIAIPTNPTPAVITLVVNTAVNDHYVTVGGSEVYASGTVALTVATELRDDLNAIFPGIAGLDGSNLTIDSAILNSVGGADWAALEGMSFGGYVTTGQVAMLSYTDHVEDVVATPVDTHCFPLIHWEGFYDGKNAEFLNVINPVFDGVALPTADETDQNAWKYSYMPCVKVPYVIERIRNAAGVGYVAGYFADNADAAQLILVSDRTSDKVYTDYVQADAFQYRNGFEQEIVLNKHVPKMTALDFLLKLATGLNLIIDYKDGGLHFTKALDLVTPAPVDWTEYVNPVRYNRAITKPLGVLLSYPLDEAEAYEPSPAQLQEYELGDAGVRVEMPFRAIYMGTGSLTGHGTFRCPHTNRKGKCPAYGQDQATMATYLMFYRGVGASSLPEDYEYAALDEFDADGSTVTGGLSLELDGTYGLVAQNYGDTLGYSDKSELDIAAVLPVGELYRLRKWENARVRFYHPNGSVTVVLRSVEFEGSVRLDAGWVEVKARGVIE